MMAQAVPFPGEQAEFSALVGAIRYWCLTCGGLYQLSGKLCHIHRSLVFDERVAAHLIELRRNAAMIEPPARVQS